MILETTLVPFVDADDDGKFNNNFYLGLFYYDPLSISSIEPSGIVYENGKEETVTKVFKKDGSFELIKIAPIDFYKYIARVHGQLNLTFINQCTKVDKIAVQELTKDMTLRRE